MTDEIAALRAEVAELKRLVESDNAGIWEVKGHAWALDAALFYLFGIVLAQDRSPGAHQRAEALLEHLRQFVRQRATEATTPQDKRGWAEGVKAMDDFVKHAKENLLHLRGGARH